MCRRRVNRPPVHGIIAVRQCGGKDLTQWGLSAMEFAAKNKKRSEVCRLPDGPAQEVAQTEERPSAGLRGSDRATAPCGEEPVPASQAAGSRSAQENCAVVQPVRAGQSGAGAACDFPARGHYVLHAPYWSRKPCKRPEDRPNGVLSRSDGSSSRGQNRFLHQSAGKQALCSSFPGS